MRSGKRYTNLNFTKRVDHENGFTPDRRESEPAVCEECGAVYTKGRWTKDAPAAVRFEKDELQKRPCPACRQIKNGVPSGFVYIEGDFFAAHREEIENLLKNEEKKISLTNPLARIMDWKRAPRPLTVTTTTGHLAQHLGRSLNRAYGGDVEYDFSHENKLARVYWRRD